MLNPLDVGLLIDLNDPDQVRKLAAELGATDEAVIAAGQMVGRMPKAILFYLQSKSRGPKRVITAEDRARSALLKQRRRPKRVAAAGDG